MQSWFGQQYFDRNVWLEILSVKVTESLLTAVVSLANKREKVLPGLQSSQGTNIN